LTLELIGRTEGGVKVHVDPMFPRLIRRDQLEADVYSLFLGVPEHSERPQWQRLSVELTPTAIAHGEREWLARSPTGEIKALPEARPKRAPTIVSLESGAARFVRRYEFHDIEVSGIPGLVRVPTPVLAIDVKGRRRSGNFRDLCRRIGDEVEDALRVISLLSRRQVRWTRIRHSSRGPKGNPWWEDGEWSRPMSATGNEVRRSALLNAYRLPPAALDQLVKAYRSLPFKAAAAASITYTIASFDAEVVDTQLANAFTGFEALVNGIGEATGSWRTMRRRQYDKLRAIMQREIAVFGTEHQLAEWQAAEVREKLAELQRRPIVERAYELLTEYAVEWSDLWPPGIDLREALRAAYRRRNDFVHAGRLPSPLRASADARRIRALSERLLLRCLGADPDWHDHFSFQDARDMATANVAQELGDL
jgi:hypothetical protein